MDLLNANHMEIASAALDGLAARHKAIVSNIANADTPDYKRKDVTFEDQLKKIMSTHDIDEAKKINNSGVPGQVPIKINKNHVSVNISDFKPQIIESSMNPPDAKGNTVNIEREMSALTKNGMTYNAIASLQAKAFRGLSEIIRG